MVAASSKKEVLIVEDDSLLLKTYKNKFTKEAIPFQVATDGEEALAFLDQDPPAVVLLDLMLPKLDGFEVLEALRKKKKWGEVPVIILSNLNQPEDMKRGKELGADDYFIKADMKIQDIVAAVKKYL